MRCEGEKFLQEQMPNRKVAVIGDIMLDKYITGDVNRISPEAPVPVSVVTRQRAVLGGAANTAANLAALGCQVFSPTIKCFPNEAACIRYVTCPRCNISKQPLVKTTVSPLDCHSLILFLSSFTEMGADLNDFL